MLPHFPDFVNNFSSQYLTILDKYILFLLLPLPSLLKEKLQEIYNKAKHEKCGGKMPKTARIACDPRRTL